MISLWLKIAYVLLGIVDVVFMTAFWDVIGGGFWGVVFVLACGFNLVLGMAIVQMGYAISFHKQVHEIEDEVDEIHTFHYKVERQDDSPSKVITLIDSREREPDLPPVS